jgi:hypothetical protein
MPMPVEGVDADTLALVAEVLEIVAVGGIARRDKTLTSGEGLRLIDQLPLFECADWDLARSPALAPGVLEHEGLTAVSPRGDDLDRLLSAQAECGLQAERNADAECANLFDLVHGEVLSFRNVGDVNPIRNAVSGIGPGDDVLLANLLGPPAQRRHPVLDGAGRELFSEPALDELLDVLWL